ncbi:thioesterase II family protein [Anaeromyxobacter diazotrophicus]|uniref:Thioesterase n=1 Tax=Anaeromyxobacter diazotrophicus TaxID=2590199 RepID=A0A7I9VMZ8_9BACT|nr:alpha/beta fold hydrolase [Anaeromyxobacter diazotrophicus]GEJ57775.1 thioesterase [Anaeromyxobacter diazotrophicus]
MSAPEPLAFTASPPASPWLPYPPRPAGGRLRLFCFPHSGAGASAYACWRRALASAEVCPVELPGHGRRLGEPRLCRMESLVRGAVGALLPFLRPPFALFGHSLGALVAFEVARTLEREHQLSPAVLIASGHGAPQLARPRESLHALSEPELVARIERMGGTPAGVLTHPELRALFVPVLRADLELGETYAYRPGPPLACPVSALGGLDDDEVGWTELEGWREQTRGGWKLRMLPGGHFFPFAHGSGALAALAEDLGGLARGVT